MFPPRRIINNAPTVRVVRLSVLLGFIALADTADVHGLGMYYEVHGQGSPILLLHGGSATIQVSFSKQIDLLARSHRVIAVEQMAHGHTPDVPGRALSYESMTSDTALFLKQLNPGKVDVIGWSDGGQIALRLAAFHPELVRRVIASGVGFGANPANRKSIENMGWENWPSEFRAGYAATSPDGDGHWPVVWRKLCRMWAGSTWGFTPGDLTRIVAPTLIVAGDHDFTSVSETKRLASLIPNARLLILPNTTHFTFQTRAGQLNPILLQFLDEPDHTQ